MGLVLVLLVFFSGAPVGAAEKEPWWAHILGFDPAVPLDPEEMDRLVSEVEGDDAAETRPLVEAIMRVTAQRDARFKDLIGRMDLRKWREIDLALCAYEYAINGNENALDRLITADAAQELGGDYVTIALMGMIDEWDRTIESVWRHKAHSDGTAGATASNFLYSKLNLFPESFARFRESISTEQKVVERLASTIADDPKMDHDHGYFYRFWGWEESPNPVYHDTVGFVVKELPREGAEPLIFVGLGKNGRDALDAKRNYVLEPAGTGEGGKRVWRDVTDRVLPDKKYHSIRLNARRNDEVIETAIYVAPYSRGDDLVWEDGKFVVREADGKNLSPSSRDPYSPSR